MKEGGGRSGGKKGKNYRVHESKHVFALFFVAFCCRCILCCVGTSGLTAWVKLH